MAPGFILPDHRDMSTQTPLAERLKAIMAERNLKAAPLARSAGVGVDFVRDILRGHVRSPRSENLAKLAVALDMSLDQLLDESAAPPRTNGFHEGQATPWTPPPPRPGQNDLTFEQALRLVCPGAEAPGYFRSAVSLPGFGILTGDLIVIDLKRPAEEGDIVVVNAADHARDRATTLIRRLLRPYLVASETSLGQPPELADGKANAIMGPVVGVIRAKES